MKFIIKPEYWEDGEYIVTIKPDFEKSYNSHPLGYTLSQQESKLVAEWLQSSINDLFKIFTNITKDENVT